MSSSSENFYAGKKQASTNANSGSSAAASSSSSSKGNNSSQNETSTVIAIMAGVAGCAILVAGIITVLVPYVRRRRNGITLHRDSTKMAKATAKANTRLDKMTNELDMELKTVHKEVDIQGRVDTVMSAVSSNNEIIKPRSSSGVAAAKKMAAMGKSMPTLNRPPTAGSSFAAKPPISAANSNSASASTPAAIPVTTAPYAFKRTASTPVTASTPKSTVPEVALIPNGSRAASSVPSTPVRSASMLESPITGNPFDTPAMTTISLHDTPMVNPYSNTSTPSTSAVSTPTGTRTSRFSMSNLRMPFGGPDRA
jgi:hypothetical protein